jgi:hypothetical protein
VDEVRTAGRSSVQFDGRNLGSGIYISRMAVDGNPVFARKMTLLK